MKPYLFRCTVRGADCYVNLATVFRVEDRGEAIDLFTTASPGEFALSITIVEDVTRLRAALAARTIE